MSPTAHDGASGDAFESALMQQLATPKREYTADEHFYLAIAKDVAHLPDTARMAVRMATLQALADEMKKLAVCSTLFSSPFNQQLVEHKKAIAEFETVFERSWYRAVLT
ncbi:unnamed protein product, partial [Nesidiocoris tenuis]